MGLIAKDEGGTFELAPEDTHVARCYRVLDFGTTYNEKWKKSSHKILITWELPNTKMTDGRPFSIGQKYTLSLNDRAILRQHLESWRSKAFTEKEIAGFDISKLIGATCLLAIVHDTHDNRTYANIKSIMKLPQGTPCPDPVNDPVIFDLDNFDQGVFNSFTEGLQKAIGMSEEYQSMLSAGVAGRSSGSEGIYETPPEQSKEELDAVNREEPVSLDDIPF